MGKYMFLQKMPSDCISSEISDGERRMRVGVPGFERSGDGFAYFDVGPGHVFSSTDAVGNVQDGRFNVRLNVGEPVDITYKSQDGRLIRDTAPPEELVTAWRNYPNHEKINVPGYDPKAEIVDRREESHTAVLKNRSSVHFSGSTGARAEKALVFVGNGQSIMVDADQAVESRNAEGVRLGRGRYDIILHEPEITVFNADGTSVRMDVKDLRKQCEDDRRAKYEEAVRRFGTGLPVQVDDVPASRIVPNAGVDEQGRSLASVMVPDIESVSVPGQDKGYARFMVPMNAIYPPLTSERGMKHTVLLGEARTELTSYQVREADGSWRHSYRTCDEIGSISERELIGPEMVNVKTGRAELAREALTHVLPVCEERTPDYDGPDRW